MRGRGLRLLLVTLLVLAGGVTTAGPAGATAPPPDVIALPNGFQPEGIAVGRGSSFYVGSLVDGAIYRGDLLTGQGSVFIGGVPGQVAVGLEIDSRNRLFVSGGPTGAARVYDASSGNLLASYQFGGTDGSSFINDVVVTRYAAYFTDSLKQRLYVVPVFHGILLKRFFTLPLTGDLQYGPGFNLNGIEASPTGRTLLAVQSSTGLLFAINAFTGRTTEVDLNGVALTNGDGLLRRGSTLYVVQNRLNEIAEIQLAPSYRSGTKVGTLTNPNFLVPTTIGALGTDLYAVNARFGTPPTPETAYTVVRVPTG